ncbi:MAG: DNA polymerase IV [bacterium]|jgi:DNA polymerase-4|nr:DNA polymerase IV [bacterium]
MIQRIIMHVDMDAFFASVEQRDHPELKGLPVAVGGSPEERGVVAAASYEARTFGIRSAMPMGHAFRLCPHLIRCVPRFEVYRQVSCQIHAIFQQITPLVEPVSLDEAYLEISQQSLDYEHGEAIGKRIRTEILATTRLTASVGIGPNKFLAKIASDFDKPDGLFVIRPHDAESFLEPLPVRVIPGIGKRTEQRLTELDIETIRDFKRLTLGELQGILGPKYGERLYYMARGIDYSPVVTERQRKSLSTERTFNRDIAEKKEMKPVLQELAQDVGEHLIRSKLRGRTVGIKVRLDNFQILVRSISIPHYTDDANEIGQIACRLLNQVDLFGRKVRLLGIRMSGFESEPGENGTRKDRPVQALFWD